MNVNTTQSMFFFLFLSSNKFVSSLLFVPRLSTHLYTHWHRTLAPPRLTPARMFEALIKCRIKDFGIPSPYGRRKGTPCSCLHQRPGLHHPNDDGVLLDNDKRSSTERRLVKKLDYRLLPTINVHHEPRRCASITLGSIVCVLTGMYLVVAISHSVDHAPRT